MATSFNVYAFDCGTTNWQISCLSCQEIITNKGSSKIETLGQPNLLLSQLLTTYCNV